MNWCILIPLLVGAICAILGYLLGKLLGGGNHDECNTRIAKLEADLNACKLSKVSLEGDLKTTKASLASSVSAEASAKASLESTKASLASSLSAAAIAPVVLSVFDGAAAKAVFGKKIKENDLTVVEGIGPKIQGLFHDHDVKTWKALSECSIEKCQSVLDSGGERYKIHKPGTWPKQAGLASEGKWAELLKWQDELDGGK
ncbi:hypothetical protein [Algibacter sp. L1A34]|uniref:hypothetical protein n=1 Tax=Algibacter sp. L1A34 TaxID=2686365 RepID=UPI00131AA9F7|nr:hypothetical protein [Algibacter sp. L1A34]